MMENEEIYMEECEGFEVCGDNSQTRAGGVCGVACFTTGDRCGTGCGSSKPGGNHCGWGC